MKSKRPGGKGKAAGPPEDPAGAILDKAIKRAKPGPCRDWLQALANAPPGGTSSARASSKGAE